MNFSFVTIFPQLVSFYFDASILKRAVDSSLITVDYLNPRESTTDLHKKTDDYAAGGGAGLVFTPQPLFDLLRFAKSKNKNAHIIFVTPVGKPFNSNDAKRLSKKESVVLVSGRYEGIDERVIEEFADEVFSVGDFVLTGGELASLIIADSTARFIPGVLGKSESFEAESFEDGLLEAPTFSKPTVYENIGTPSILLKGNHGKISDFKKAVSKIKTKYFRPDLYKKFLSRTKP